jgi:hypothetical protein
MTYITYEYGFQRARIKSLMRERERTRQKIWRLQKKITTLGESLNAVDAELLQYRVSPAPRVNAPSCVAPIPQ